jgi:hypothetical protein
LNADADEEEETDKLLKKDHNAAIEEAVRQQRKGSSKKEGKISVHFSIWVFSNQWFCCSVSTNSFFCFETL